MFKNTIISIEQKLLKIKLKNYFQEINLIRILDTKLKKIRQSRVSTILSSFVENTRVSQT